MLALAGGCRSAQPIPPEQAVVADASRELIPITIQSGNITHVFRVELARTPAEQERGLMFRTTLAEDGGMLFPFDPPNRATFWMKNTPLPLDMVFIRADGIIARIAGSTTPLSLTPVDAGEAVAAVLEIGGGKAAAAGIKAGDHAHWPGGPD